jgi:putative acetyltransferase
VHESSLMIALDDPRRDDVLALLEEHLSDMRATSPPESIHALDPDALARPEITFWTARRGDTLLGCAALKHHSPGLAEIKSMRTATAARSQGIARSLLDAVLDAARGRGYREVSLETGSQDFFGPARSLYRRHGFAPCPPFADYRLDPNSVFMTLVLETGAPGGG